MSSQETDTIIEIIRSYLISRLIPSAGITPPTVDKIGINLNFAADLASELLSANLSEAALKDAIDENCASLKENFMKDYGHKLNKKAEIIDLSTLASPQDESKPKPPPAQISYDPAQAEEVVAAVLESGNLLRHETALPLQRRISHICGKISGAIQAGTWSKTCPEYGRAESVLINEIRQYTLAQFNLLPKISEIFPKCTSDGYSPIFIVFLYPNWNAVNPFKDTHPNHELYNTILSGALFFLDITDKSLKLVSRSFEAPESNWTEIPKNARSAIEYYRGTTFRIVKLFGTHIYLGNTNLVPICVYAAYKKFPEFIRFVTMRYVDSDVMEHGQTSFFKLKEEDHIHTGTVGAYARNWVYVATINYMTKRKIPIFISHDEYFPPANCLQRYFGRNMSQLKPELPYYIFAENGFLATYNFQSYLALNGIQDIGNTGDMRSQYKPK